MVTILEPREVISIKPAPVQEPAPLPEPVQERGRRYAWGYSTPCAGVRYYSYLPAGKPRTVPPAPAQMAPLPVKLIDERVILL